MTAALALPAATSIGPLWKTSPGWSAATGWTVATNGDIAAGIAADLGFDADEDQRWSWDAIFAEDDNQLPICAAFCVVGGRQVVGKSVTLIVAAVMDVLVLGHPVHIWTAHQSKTARKTFEDLVQRLQAHEDYAARITDIGWSRGEEFVEFDGESRIEFHARSGKSGRGFTSGRITFDEAMYLQPEDLGALVPTLVTMDDAQIRYGASGGMLRSGQLRALRKRGRSGTDPRLAYIEHGAPFRPCRTGDMCPHEIETAGCALNDRDLWRWCAPALRAGRVSDQAMVDQRQELAAAPMEFAREFFTWWEDPPNADGASAIDVDAWDGLRDPGAEVGEPLVFGVAVAPDRSWSAIGVAWSREDGDRHVMLTVEDDGTEHGRLDYRPGTGWVAARIKVLTAKWGNEVRVSRAARGVVPDAIELSSDEQAQADNALADAVTDRTVRHGNQPAVLTAVRNSAWKQLGNTRVLDQRTERDVSPVIALSLALAGLDEGGVQFW
ncbi:hypothetical protein TEK04_19520 [Klenkia sp. LSe6-5]|uniref:Terminase n=1 Tax=Klenkia sesuvii TaxID=3103137 RepID=A0ABU8DZH0_9ACTN